MGRIGGTDERERRWGRGVCVWGGDIMFMAKA